MRECPQCERCYADDVHICPLDDAQTRSTLPGGQLLADRYFLEKRLGRGAMGQVYLASDTKLKTRKVAVKTIRQDVLSSDDLPEGAAIARFEREAMAAASIRHPHVVDVTDFGESADGVFYLVMEYVEGETLHQLLRREGTLPTARAVKLLRQICDGVEAAHAAGILHRDLKPANIFLMTKGKSGDDGFVKVGDFGLAKITGQADGDSGAAPLTRGVAGTPEFMSPEQLQPEFGIDARSDVYALGTIAYLMLGGRVPFSGELMQIVTQKLTNAAPPLSTLRSDVPKAVERVIMSALETKPENRPASASEWISELEKVAENVSEKPSNGTARLIVLAPIDAEVYVDDERKGSVGSSGRLVLSTVPAGRHVLRVHKSGEKDDERVIEIREDAEEQVIQAQLKSLRVSSQPSPQQTSGGAAASNRMPEIVVCANCGARFAEGVRFCGRCGNHVFDKIVEPGNTPEIVCPRCSAAVLASAKFCGKCGLKLDAQENSPPNDIGKVGMNSLKTTSGRKICPRCGASFPPNVGFCGRCGNRLS